MSKKVFWLALSGILLLALSLKMALLWADVVVLDADEAIVGLMARHILQGERPVFFYGQAYMGSLDAWLVAGLFALFGPSVWAIRAVQSALFLAHVALTGVLVYRWSDDAKTALLSALLMAVPPLVLTLYTTVSLGGYGETLLFGDLALLAGGKLARGDGSDLKKWVVLGLLAGLGFWTLGLIAVYLVPIGVWLLWRHRLRAWRGYLAALAAFVIGSGAWWVYNFQHGWQAALALYNPADAVDPMAPVLPVQARILGLLLIGLPGLLGARLPWSIEWVSIWAAPVVIAFYAAVGLFALGQARRNAWRGVYRFLWGMVSAFAALFVFSRFGSDPTGRYFVPMYVPLVVFTASALVALGRRSRPAAIALVALLLAFNLWGTWRGANSAAKLTTQYNPQLQYGNEYDDALISFLKEHGGARGYTHYWIAFKVAFLSGEEVILGAHLPNKASGNVNKGDNRYRPYVDLVAAAGRVVYVTGRQPELDALLRSGFERRGVAYREREIGPYRVFYDLSARIEPHEIDARW